MENGENIVDVNNITIFRKKIDHSIFDWGSTIPISQHSIIDKVLGIHINRGKSVSITVILDGIEYIAKIVNADRNVLSDTYQIRYDSNKELIGYLKGKHSDIYKYIINEKSKKRKKGAERPRVAVPGTSCFELISTPDSRVFKLNVTAESDIDLERRISMGIDSLQIGDTVSNDQLTSLFSCSSQGGMRRSHKTNTLVLVSNHLKSIYEDRWINDVFHYTGMGLEGDQNIKFSQNRTVNESKINLVQMYLFEVFEEKKYSFQGRVELAKDPYSEIQPDIFNNNRKVWIFPLKIIDEKKRALISEEVFNKKNEELAIQANERRISELKKRIVYSPKIPGTRMVLSKQYERNQNLVALVKKFAREKCMLCKIDAPFRKTNGDAYLEVHHIQWLSENGEDSLDNTVALCPNCHRKMHSLNLKKDQETLFDQLSVIYSRLDEF